MSRWRIRGLVLAGVVGLQALVLMSPVGAAGACGVGEPANLLGKHSARTTSVYGTRAEIAYRNPDLCGSDSTGSGFSSVWQNIAADSVPAGDGYPGFLNYAQVGYVQIGSGAPGSTSGIHMFSQWTRKCFAHATCGANATLDQLADTQFWPAPTGPTMYAEYLRSSDDLIHLYAGGSQISVVGYDVTGDWDSSWESQYFGETHNDGDDLPGTTAAKTGFQYLQYYNASGGINNWGTLANSILAVPTRYKREDFSPSVGGLGMRLYTQ